MARDTSIRPGEWRSAWLVVVFAATLVVLGPEIASRMLHHTKGIGWETPEGSPSVSALEHANRFFPLRMRGAIVMAVEAEPGTQHVLTDAVAEFSRNVSLAIQHDGRVQAYQPLVIGYYLDALGRKGPQVQLQSELVSADKRMTVILIQPTNTNGDWSQANAFLQEFCAAPPPGYTLHITGMPAVLSGDGCSAGVHKKVNTRDMNFEVLFRAEMLTLPVALLIMGYIVKFPRLLLIPLFTVVVSFVIAAAITLPWMDLVPIPADAPAAMGSVIMALSLDYALFMLSRFSEEHRHLPLQQCVDKIKEHTCRTIFVSGILVAIAFIGSILLPERNMQGTGICLGFATLACVGTSCVLVPAVLIVAGKFFTGFMFTPMNWGDVSLGGYVTDDCDGEDTAQRSQQGGESTFWLGVIRLVEKGPVAALGAVMLLLMPVLSHLPQLNITGDAFAILPMTMPAVTAMRRVQDHFPVGVLDPYSIVIEAPMQGADFSLDSEIRQAALAAEGHDLSSMSSIAADVGLSSDDVKVTGALVHFLAEGRQKNFTTQEPQLLAAISRAYQSAQQAQPALAQGADIAGAAASSAGGPAKAGEEVAREKLPLLDAPVKAVAEMALPAHGMLLMPSGYAAMLDLCQALQEVGGVASMVGPTYAYHQPIDWPVAVALHVNSSLQALYRYLLDSHVKDNRALLEVHTRFPSIGAGGSNWVLAVRHTIAAWEAAHPGYHAELSGGASEAADTRGKIMSSMWSYLGVSVFLIVGVVYCSFHSLMVPLRLALALVFTLAATFGVGAVIYQTSLLHGLFPNLVYFDGISYEVIPLVTGVAIALGLDYDIFLVSRIVEFRLQRFSDRASIFRGVLKTGEVISAAGLIMALAFTGLCFSDKILFQQFGVLLIVSVLFDTFVVRTVLVPALMLIAQNWNWWPRDMPPPVHDVLEGEFESDGGLSRPILQGTTLGNVVPTPRSRPKTLDEWYMSGMIA